MSPDFEISSTPQVRLADGGDSPSFDIWLARLGGFGGGVNVSVVGSTLPNGASANVNENAPNLPHGAVARVTINLPGSVAPGTYDITVRGTGGGTTRSTTVRVIVEHEANGGPVMDIRELKTSGFAIPMLVKWPAGGGNYRLQRSSNGGGWTTIKNTNCDELRHDRLAGKPAAVPRPLRQRRLEVRRKLGGRAAVSTGRRQPVRQLESHVQLQLIR